jgi:hypothetical protein
MNKILNLIFFDPWSIVPNFFSFPTLLARATYMIYGGRGGGEKSNGGARPPVAGGGGGPPREVKRISVNSLFSAPHPRGGGGERAYFSVNTTCNQHIMAINITYTHPFISDTVKALSSVTF